MTKAELITAISNTTTIAKRNVETVIDSLAKLTGQALAEGNEALLPGIGKLKPKKRAAREGRNPKTGEAVKIAAKITVKFSTAKALTDALN